MGIGEYLHHRRTHPIVNFLNQSFIEEHGGTRGEGHAAGARPQEGGQHDNYYAYGGDGNDLGPGFTVHKAVLVNFKFSG